MDEKINNQDIQQPNTQSQIPPEPKHRSFLTNKLFLITLAIVVLFTIVYAGIYLYLGSQLDQISKSNQTAITTQPSPIQDETANWKTYTDDRGFSYKYPFTWNDLDYCSVPPKPGSNELSANCIKTVIFTDNLPDENADSGRDLVVSSSTDIKVAGYDAKRKILTLPGDEDESDTYEVWIYKNNKPFILWLTWIGSNTSNIQREYFIHSLDQILFTFRFNDQESRVVCTQDAKLCPDGSYVSRQPPNCEFAACPQQ